MHQVPEMAKFAESNSGLLLVSSLFVTEPAEGGTAIPISISALAAQFGIARAHAREILAQAEMVGLLRRDEESQTVIVLPKLLEVVGAFYGVLFTFMAGHAEAAAAEVRALQEGIGDGPERALAQN